MPRQLERLLDLCKAMSRHIKNSNMLSCKGCA